MDKKIKIGGPGYVGDYIIVELADGKKLGFGDCDTNWHNVDNIASQYPDAVQAYSFTKPEPYESGILVEQWKP